MRAIELLALKFFKMNTDDILQMNIERSPKCQWPIIVQSKIPVAGMLDLITKIPGVEEVKYTRYSMLVKIGQLFDVGVVGRDIRVQLSKHIIEQSKINEEPTVVSIPKIDMKDFVPPEPEIHRLYSRHTETELNKLLKEALSEEDYETAADLRDELKLRKAKNT